MLLLQAPMRLLTTRLRLPSPIAAVLVILALFGCVALMALAVSVPASDWIAKAPQSLRSRSQEKLAILEQPLAALQKVLHGVETGDQPAARRRKVVRPVTVAARQRAAGRGVHRYDADLEPDLHDDRRPVLPAQRGRPTAAWCWSR